MRSFALVSLLALLAGCGGGPPLDADPLAPIPTEVDEVEIEPPPLRVEWKHVPVTSSLITVPVDDERIRFPPPTQPPAVDARHVYSVHGDLLRAHALADGEVVWELRVAGEIALPPLAVAGGVVVATSDGRWLWIDLNGEARAMSAFGSQPIDAVALSEGIVATDASSVFFLDTAQLAEGPLVRWQVELAGVTSVAASPDGSTLVVVTEDGALTALDSTDGRRIWRNDTVEAISAGAAVGVERAFAVSSEGRLHALRLRDGKRSWLGKETGVRVVGAPATVGRLVWVGGLDAALHAYDLATGSHMHRVPTSGRSVLDLATWGRWVIASPEYGPWTIVRGPLFANGPADPGQPRSYTIPSTDDLVLPPGSGIPGVAVVDASGELSLLRPRAQPAPTVDEESG